MPVKVMLRFLTEFKKHFHTWRIAPKVTPRMLCLAVCTLVQAASVDWNNFNERILTNFGQQ
jgi:hypothetical protein